MKPNMEYSDGDSCSWQRIVTKALKVRTPTKESRSDGFERFIRAGKELRETCGETLRYRCDNRFPFRTAASSLYRANRRPRTDQIRSELWNERGGNLSAVGRRSFRMWRGGKSSTGLPPGNQSGPIAVRYGPQMAIGHSVTTIEM